MGRVNAADNANNGLLLRNLFGDWPRESLAQVYSGGDNGDEGFFGRYYELGPQERRLGRLFFRLKKEARGSATTAGHERIGTHVPVRWSAALRSCGQRLLMDTGLYELLFRPRLSTSLGQWVDGFQPDIVLAQGYNLTFTWLPLMLADAFGLPIAYYPTDDWPSARYLDTKGFLGFARRSARRAVETTSRQLVGKAAVAIAFSPYMQEEYRQRYAKEFHVLMHGDDVGRFEAAGERRLAASDECWIVTTGAFVQYRWPLLHDLDQACEVLGLRGLKVRVTVFPVSLPSGVADPADEFRHIQFEASPSHQGLAAMLRGADILFLPERFDDTVDTIRLSVSSKAHLFMFSGRPIVVYSDPKAGITRYAREEGWAAVVDHKDPLRLANTLEALLVNGGETLQLVARARQVALRNHHLPTIQREFRSALISAIPEQGQHGHG
jgi:hypothetical protein